jgi:hypothetical protein
MWIRVLLLIGLASIGYFAFLRRHRMPLHIMLIMAFLASAAGMVIFPDVTNWAAARVGVGRGADLVTYVVEVSLLFIVIHYYSKFVLLQQQLTTLTRELAFVKRELEVTGGSEPADG